MSAVRPAKAVHGASAVRRPGVWPAEPRRWLTRLRAPRAGAALLSFLAVGALVLYPMARLAAEAVVAGPGVWSAVFSSPSVRLALGNTLVATLGATLLATLAGGTLALLTHRSRTPGRKALGIGLVLPVLVPPFISAFGWVQAYGPAGLLDQVLGVQLPGLFGGFGVTLLLATQGAPVVYLACLAGLRGRGAPDLERAARASGASSATVLRTVTVPLLAPALAAGAGLVFLLSASDFGIPAMVGIPGRFPTLTTEIYKQLTFASSRSSFSAAVVLAAGLALLALGALAIVGRVGQGAPVEPSRGGLGRPGRPGVRDAVASAACWLYVLATSGVPMVALLAVAATRAYGLPQTPENWTLDNFVAVLSSRRGAALGNSLSLSSAAAFGALALSALLLALPTSARLGHWLSAAVALPYAVPGSTVGVAAILAFGGWWYGSFALILAAYLGRFWALAERPLRAALSQVGPDGARAARAAGASPLRAAWSVVVPRIWPAVGVAWALVFVSAFHELTVSSLLYGPRTETVAVVVLDAQQAGDVPVTAALAVLLTGVILALVLPVLLFPPLARLAGWGSEL